VLRSYANGLTDYKQLKDKPVTAIDSVMGFPHSSTGRCRNAFTASLNTAEMPYCLNARKWYRVTRDYAQDVNKVYEQSATHDVTGYPIRKKGTHEGPITRSLRRAVAPSPSSPRRCASAQSTGRSQCGADRIRTRSRCRPSCTRCRPSSCRPTSSVAAPSTRRAAGTASRHRHHSPVSVH
jgi:hypothetical protein